MKQSQAKSGHRRPSGSASPESRRQRKFRKRRDAIVEAARKVFERKGYEHASIEEIAGEADFAKGSIYYYFDNKASLLDAVIGDEIDRICAVFQRAAGEDHNPLGRLSALVREILGFYERNFALFRFTMMPLAAAAPSGETDEAASLREKCVEVFRRNREVLARTIRAAQEEARLSATVAAEEATDLLQGLIHAEVRRWDERGRGENLVEKETLITDLFVYGLAPRNPIRVEKTSQGA